MTRFRILLMSALSLGCAAVYRPVFPVLVWGGSMSPTYSSGQFVIATAVSKPLHRGDVVILNHDGDTLIKRIAFTAGDSYMQVHEVGGTWFTPCIGGSMKSLVGHRLVTRRLTVPNGMIYVVGDNFAASVDSNVFGPVPLDSVTGVLLDQRRPDFGASFVGARFVGPTGWAEKFFTVGNRP